MTKCAIYARVSTRDKDQNPETQLMPLREEAKRLGYEIRGLYIDKASAQDIAHRTGWRELLDDAAKKHFQVVLVFKLDRAFRSVKDMHDTLSVWEVAGIEFRSLRENFETRTAYGRLMLNLLASMAEFELEIIRERVAAGMDRARAQGTKSGRPIGRPQRRVPVQKVLGVYRRHRSVGVTAEVVGIPRATVHRTLKNLGALDELPPIHRKPGRDGGK